MNMRYSVDRVESGIAVLEDIDSGVKKEVDIKLIPKDVHDGSIVIFEDGKYILDLEEEKVRRKNILSRFERLKKR